MERLPETFVITVQRDTDGDGEPDITDTDDDGDGFTDIEEEEKGTDPKDPNSVPQVDPKPVKPDQKQKILKFLKNKVVNNVVNNSYKSRFPMHQKQGFWQWNRIYRFSCIGCGIDASSWNKEKKKRGRR